MPGHEPPPLLFPDSAIRINEKITTALNGILSSTEAASYSPVFRDMYRPVLSLYDEFQAVVLGASGLSIPCTGGCSVCCCHWADDVYSFEAGIIAGLVRDMAPCDSARIVRDCARSFEEYERIRKAALERIEAGDFDFIEGVIDPDEIILKSFYLLESRCPFQDRAGRCVVYEWRPLTCRAYINLGDSALCPPDMIDEEDTMTMILDVDDEANALLEELHSRYERFPGDRGLRSQVLKILRG